MVDKQVNTNELAIKVKKSWVNIVKYEATKYQLAPSGKLCVLHLTCERYLAIGFAWSWKQNDKKDKPNSKS